MKQTFLVKHAVSGRLFYDSRKSDIAYSVSQSGEGWLFTVNAPMNETMVELLRCKEELNVFLFQEYENQPTLKTWYYVKDGPVRYDEAAAQLTIYAHSCIEYYPHEYSQ